MQPTAQAVGEFRKSSKAPKGRKTENGDCTSLLNCFTADRKNMPLDTLTFVIVSVIKSGITLFILLTAVAYTVWLERKVVGHMQNRWGPSRVGPFGLLQPAADGIKFLMKEDLTPPHVYRPLFIAAPMIAVICALTSISVIPFGNAITVFGLLWWSLVLFPGAVLLLLPMGVAGAARLVVEADGVPRPARE